MVVQKRIGGTIAFLTLVVVAPSVISSSAYAQYTVTNLVSNVPGLAQHQDTSLVNAWGVSYAPGGYFWVSDEGTGLSTLYNAAGIKQALVVKIPASGTGIGQPTGQVYNGTSDFVVTQNGHSGAAQFIFDTLDGTISGWAPGVNATTAVIAVNSTGASYTGLAIGVSNSANFIYAADNRNNKVDMYDKTFHLVKSFTDASLPAGSNPYNVQNIGGQLYVTFTNALDGGVVDVFDTSGNKIKTLISGGKLHNPWGVALAPANFGPASKALLVGNEGDGRINAFNPITGKFLGQSAVSFSGLWALIFGDGLGFNGKTNQLFLASGPGGYLRGFVYRGERPLKFSR